jgi:alpha-N-arabinofuranosidase
MEYTLKEGKKVLIFTKRFEGKEEILAEKFVDAKRLYLKVETYGQDYSFYYGERLEDWNELVKNVDGRLLSRELAGGFTGAYVGMYATSKGSRSENAVDFDWFEYSGI